MFRFELYRQTNENDIVWCRLGTYAWWCSEQHLIYAPKTSSAPYLLQSFLPSDQLINVYKPLMVTWLTYRIGGRFGPPHYSSNRFQILKKKKSEQSITYKATLVWKVLVFLTTYSKIKFFQTYCWVHICFTLWKRQSFHLLPIFIHTEQAIKTTLEFQSRVNKNKYLQNLKSHKFVELLAEFDTGN